jgi:hypothetical protein
LLAASTHATRAAARVTANACTAIGSAEIRAAAVVEIAGRAPILAVVHITRHFDSE